MKKQIIILLVLNFIFGLPAYADPLGIARIIDDGPARIDFLFRSDLWTSPNHNKPSPIRIHHLKINVPVVRNEEWKFNTIVASENLRIGNAGLTVGEDQVDIAGDLRSEAVSFSLEKKYADHSISTFFGSYSSDSDEPFRDSRDRAFDFSFYHKFPSQGVWQWVAGFDRTKNRGIYNDKLVPLFGVIYTPNPDFNLVVGFLFFKIAWLHQSWQKKITLTPVGSEVQLSHPLDEFIKFDLRAGVSNRAYMNTQRLDDEKRIIFEEKYLELAASRKVSDKTSLETDIGYSFHRRLYEGKQVLSPIGDIVSVKPDLYGSMKVRFEF